MCAMITQQNISVCLSFELLNIVAFNVSHNDGILKYGKCTERPNIVMLQSQPRDGDEKSNWGRDVSKRREKDCKGEIEKVT